MAHLPRRASVHSDITDDLDDLEELAQQMSASAKVLQQHVRMYATKRAANALVEKENEMKLSIRPVFDLCDRDRDGCIERLDLAEVLSVFHDDDQRDVFNDGEPQSGNPQTIKPQP